MPAISRKAPNITGPVASAQAAVNTEKINAHARMARLRPRLSAIRPAASAPIIMPMKTIDPMVPAEAAFSPHPVALINWFWTDP